MNGSGADKTLQPRGWQPPETRRDPVPPPIPHKSPAWKPDNLIALSSRFIINIFIKLIAEKSPGLLEQHADSFARGSSYHWWGCFQGNKPRLSWCLRPHDRQIAAPCESDTGNLEQRAEENVIFFGDNYNCTFVLAWEHRPGATWKEDSFSFFILGRAKNTCFCTFACTVIDQVGDCCTMKQRLLLYSGITAVYVIHTTVCVLLFFY